MRRTDRFWGPVSHVDVWSLHCPLCRALLTGYGLRAPSRLPVHDRPGLLMHCEAGGMTLAKARELDAFRQRAHP